MADSCGVATSTHVDCGRAWQHFMCDRSANGSRCNRRDRVNRPGSWLSQILHRCDARSTDDDIIDHCNDLNDCRWRLDVFRRFRGCWRPQRATKHPSRLSAWFVGQLVVDPVRHVHRRIRYRSNHDHVDTRAARVADHQKLRIRSAVVRDHVVDHDADQHADPADGRRDFLFPRHCPTGNHAARHVSRCHTVRRATLCGARVAIRVPVAGSLAAHCALRQMTHLASINHTDAPVEPGVNTLPMISKLPSRSGEGSSSTTACRRLKTPNFRAI